MEPKAPPEMLRPLRLLLTAEGIRLMDECIYRGLGGYTNRHDFVRDAIENHALEILYPEGTEAADGPLPQARTQKSKQQHLATGETTARRAKRAKTSSLPPAYESVELADVAETALGVPPDVTTVDNQLARVRREPLIGLHNRDWPSLWALSVVAAHTADGPRPLRDVYAKATEDAWRLGMGLRQLEEQNGRKLTSLLPTNPEKPQSAEAGFQAFAIGAVARRPGEDGRFEASGPLYVWGALALVPGDNGPAVGVTPEGLRLLELMAGLTVAPPHASDKAGSFFDYLREHGPEDWAGFGLLLDAIADGVSRLELADRFIAMREWSESVASSSAQGYLARGREWGLVFPKLVDGGYRLTEFGEQLLEATGGNRKSRRLGRSGQKRRLHEKITS